MHIPRFESSVRRIALGTMLAIAGLHVAWGIGSSYPFANRDRLADAVVGADEVPPPVACFAVAAALLVGAAAISDRAALPPRLRMAALRVMVVVLGVRGVLGLLGATKLVSPASTSPTFRQRDRTMYSPLILALAFAAFLTTRHLKGSGNAR